MHTLHEWLFAKGFKSENIYVAKNFGDFKKAFCICFDDSFFESSRCVWLDSSCSLGKSTSKITQYSTKIKWNTCDYSHFLDFIYVKGNTVIFTDLLSQSIESDLFGVPYIQTSDELHREKT